MRDGPRYQSCCSDDRLVRLHGRNHLWGRRDNRLCRRVALSRRDDRHLRRWWAPHGARRSGPVAGAAEAANPESSTARGQAHPDPPSAPLFGGMGFTAADAARWRWSTVPPSVQWAGCVLLLAAILFMYWTCARTASQRRW